MLQVIWSFGATGAYVILIQVQGTLCVKFISLISLFRLYSLHSVCKRGAVHFALS